MENNELIIKRGNIEITFAELDIDNEMGINIECSNNNIFDIIIYLGIDDTIKIRDHVNQVITNFNINKK